MDEEKEGILATAKDMAVETGAVIIDTAKASFEGAKDLVVSGATAAGEAVTTVAKKARQVVSKPRRAKPKAAKSGTSKRRTARKKPAPKAASRGMKVSRASTGRAGRKSPTRKSAIAGKARRTTKRSSARRGRR